MTVLGVEAWDIGDSLPVLTARAAGDSTEPVAVRTSAEAVVDLVHDGLEQNRAVTSPGVLYAVSQERSDPLPDGVQPIPHVPVGMAGG